MTIQVLAAYLVQFLIAVVPISEHAYREPPDLTEARYSAVATTIASVVLDEDEVPMFAGTEADAGRVQTALVLASIAAHESYLRADVIECRVAGIRGALSAYQFELRRPRVCISFYEDTRLALSMARQSFAACSRLPFGDRLSLFTSGACQHQRESRMRVLRAMAWWKTHPAPAWTE